MTLLAAKVDTILVHSVTLGEDLGNRWIQLSLVAAAAAPKTSATGRCPGWQLVPPGTNPGRCTCTPATTAGIKADGLTKAFDQVKQCIFVRQLGLATYGWGGGARSL